MRILLAGSSGLIGAALLAHLKAAGHQVDPLLRDKTGWNPQAGELSISRVRDYEAVVHLGGINIAARRWSDRVKQQIRDSRVNSTRLLAQTLSQLPQKPRVLVIASAVGYFGSRGNEILTESALPGEGFLAEVCQAWEAAGAAASDAGIRVVHARFGMVLSRRGGALAKMLWPFKLGLGGIIGSGKQYWPWVSLDDAVGAIAFSLEHESIMGPMNVVSPESVTCREFTKTLGRVLHRPTLFPMPAFVARCIMGPMADELVLASVRAQPTKLLQAGYVFCHSNLQDALRHAQT